MNQRWATRHSGFTIVELILVIAVIAILAVVTIVGYSAVRRNGAIRTLQSDLARFAETTEANSAFTGGTYPTANGIETSMKTSNGVTVKAYTYDLPHYSNMTAVQNGVLIATICQNLIDEGYGNGQNAGGGTDDYIQNCGNWNKSSMQFTAWTTKVFPVPVSSSAFTDYANSVPAGDSYHPNQQSTVQTFYRELNKRFVMQGGLYPVTTFWDSWANAGNGGVMKQELPTPDSALSGKHFCIEGTYSGINDTWHIWDGGVPKSGTC